MTLRIMTTLPTLALLAACTAVGPNFQAPEAPLAPSFVGGDGTAIGVTANDQWWLRLNDSQLNTLIARGLAQNISIESALTRVQAASARIDTTGTNAQLGGGVDANIRRAGSDLAPTAYSNGATLSANYVLDIFGGARRGRQQAVANYQAAVFDTGTARLALLSSIVGAYTDLRFFQESLALTRQNISSRQQTLDLVVEQRDIGSANELQLAQAQALYDQTRAQLAPLEAGFNASVFAIATLLAEPAGPLMAELQRGAAQPGAPRASATGVPANLLRNRPDILAAEQRYAAAVASVGVAEAQLYPSLNLGGSVTVGSTDSWNFGPSLNLALFNRGALTANRNAAIATAEGAELDWRSTVLGAVAEVQTAQSNLLRKRRELSALRDVLASNARVQELTRLSYEGGASTLLDMLDAERATDNASLSVAATRRELTLAWMALEIATGRGWATGGAVVIAQ